MEGSVKSDSLGDVVQNEVILGGSCFMAIDFGI